MNDIFPWESPCITTIRYVCTFLYVPAKCPTDLQPGENNNLVAGKSPVENYASGDPCQYELRQSLIWGTLQSGIMRLDNNITCKHKIIATLGEDRLQHTDTYFIHNI